MFIRRNLFFIFLVMLIIFPAKGMAKTPETHKRSNWYIGFGLGAGLDARYTIDGNEITFDDWFKGVDTKDTRVALNFKVGATLSPKTLLGFDGIAVGQMGSYAGSDLQLQINNYFLMLTHFPIEEGLFVRVGGGLSNIMYKVGGSTNVVPGYGLLGGVGYAFWIGKSFNLTLTLDHSRQFYYGSVGEPDTSQFTIAYLGFDWY
ncbi:MAG: hypothetical protein IT393_03020 [Nitrospirae bacterium]|nr:hypothetical protein [Nitrospirota bacterium]